MLKRYLNNFFNKIPLNREILLKRKDVKVLFFIDNSEIEVYEDLR